MGSRQCRTTLCKRVKMIRMDSVNSYEAVVRLATDHPDWMPVVRAAFAVQRQSSGGEVTYTWVQLELERQTGGRMPGPNLKRLASYGILQKTDESRQGRRAYYRMPDPAGVDRALQQLGF